MRTTFTKKLAATISIALAAIGVSFSAPLAVAPAASAAESSSTSSTAYIPRDVVSLVNHCTSIPADKMTDCLNSYSKYFTDPALYNLFLTNGTLKNWYKNYYYGLYGTYPYTGVDPYFNPLYNGYLVNGYFNPYYYSSYDKCSSYLPHLLPLGTNYLSKWSDWKSCMINNYNSTYQYLPYFASNCAQYLGTSPDYKKFANCLDTYGRNAFAKNSIYYPSRCDWAKPGFVNGNLTGSWELWGSCLNNLLAGDTSNNSKSSSNTTKPSTPTSPFGMVTRLEGSDRVGTSLAVFDKAPSTSMILAGSNGIADVLSSGPLAAMYHSSVVYTPTNTLPDEVLQTLKKNGVREVVVLGGTRAVSNEVLKTLRENNIKPIRISGPNRYATAIAVANYLAPRYNKAVADMPIVVATGHVFADSLVAGPVAVSQGGALLLTNGGNLSPELYTYLASTHSPITAVGGAAEKAILNSPFANRLQTTYKGIDRFQTSAIVASSVFAGANNYAVVNGQSAPDGAVAGGFISSRKGAVLLTYHSHMTSDVSSLLKRGDNVFVIGGKTVISSRVVDELSSRVQ